jgi:Family of unknown function (DUF6069)
MENFSPRRLLWAGPLTTGLAVLANLLFYAVSKTLGAQYRMTFGGPSKPAIPLPVLSIVLATLVAAIGAVLIFALLLKITHIPLPPFLSIAAAALLVSFGGPLSLTGDTSLATKLLLSSMHLISAIVIVGGLLLFTREG